MKHAVQYSLILSMLYMCTVFELLMMVGKTARNM